jgi:hypothetical protein
MFRCESIRFDQQQGYDPQALAGHKDAGRTAIYKDNRGAERVCARRTMADTIPG